MQNKGEISTAGLFLGHVWNFRVGLEFIYDSTEPTAKIQPPVLINYVASFLSISINFAIILKWKCTIITEIQMESLNITSLI